MITLFHKRFEKQFAKLPARIQDQFQLHLEVFSDDPFNPVLRNHALIGRQRAYRSINVTGDIRALYRELDQATVLFTHIGSHSELYE